MDSALDNVAYELLFDVQKGFCFAVQIFFLDLLKLNLLHFKTNDVYLDENTINLCVECSVILV